MIDNTKNKWGYTFYPCPLNCANFSSKTLILIGKFIRDINVR